MVKKKEVSWPKAEGREFIDFLDSLPSGVRYITDMEFYNGRNAKIVSIFLKGKTLNINNTKEGVFQKVKQTADCNISLACSIYFDFNNTALATDKAELEKKLSAVKCPIFIANDYHQAINILEEF
jgi:hypothetical protein